jgi:MFS-type transporter involved in bile tolerance (Atg22 family)
MATMSSIREKGFPLWETAAVSFHISMTVTEFPVYTKPCVPGKGGLVISMGQSSSIPRGKVELNPTQATWLRIAMWCFHKGKFDYEGTLILPEGR